MKDTQFQEQAEVFNNKDATKSDIIVAGEKSLLPLYNERSEQSLDSLRYLRFCQKITKGTSFLQPERLPPPSAAAVYHSLRVYHQVQQWRGVALPPQDWAWKLVDARLLPVRTDLPAAHQFGSLPLGRSGSGFMIQDCSDHGVPKERNLGS